MSQRSESDDAVDYSEINQEFGNSPPGPVNDASGALKDQVAALQKELQEERTEREALKAQKELLDLKLEEKTRALSEHKQVAKRIRGVANACFPNQDLKGDLGLKDPEDRWCKWVVTTLKKYEHLHEYELAICQLAQDQGIGKERTGIAASLEHIKAKLAVPVIQEDHVTNLKVTRSQILARQTLIRSRIQIAESRLFTSAMADIIGRMRHGVVNILRLTEELGDISERIEAFAKMENLDGQLSTLEKFYELTGFSGWHSINDAFDNRLDEAGSQSIPDYESLLATAQQVANASRQHADFLDSERCELTPDQKTYARAHFDRLIMQQFQSNPNWDPSSEPLTDFPIKTRPSRENDSSQFLAFIQKQLKAEHMDFKYNSDSRAITFKVDSEVRLPDDTMQLPIHPATSSSQPDVVRLLEPKLTTPESLPNMGPPRRMAGYCPVEDYSIPTKRNSAECSPAPTSTKRHASKFSGPVRGGTVGAFGYTRRPPKALIDPNQPFGFQNLAQTHSSTPASRNVHLRLDATAAAPQTAYGRNVDTTSSDPQHPAQDTEDSNRNDRPDARSPNSKSLNY